MAPVAVRIGVLVCDPLADAFRAQHGDYGRLYGQLLARSLARIGAETALAVDSYDVHALAFPPDDVRHDALLISGSRASAYEDVEWINALVAYVQRVLVQRPSVKIFGICFGHQIVARALGGACVPNDGRWEVAVTSVRLTPLGKAIFGADVLDVQQMHADHVPACPPNAHILGATDLTPNQGMVVFDDPASASASAAHVDLASIRVFTVQGHPEFTAPIMFTLLNARIILLGEDVVRDGLARAGGIPGHHYPDGLACDGVDKVGRVMWGILGVA